MTKLGRSTVEALHQVNGEKFVLQFVPDQIFVEIAQYVYLSIKDCRYIVRYIYLFSSTKLSFNSGCRTFL